MQDTEAEALIMRCHITHACIHEPAISHLYLVLLMVGYMKSKSKHVPKNLQYENTTQRKYVFSYLILFTL